MPTHSYSLRGTGVAGDMMLEARCVWKEDKRGQAHLEAKGSAGRERIEWTGRRKSREILVSLGRRKRLPTASTDLSESCRTSGNCSLRKFEPPIHSQPSLESYQLTCRSQESSQRLPEDRFPAPKSSAEPDYPATGSNGWKASADHQERAGGRALGKTREKVEEVFEKVHHATPERLHFPFASAASSTLLLGDDFRTGRAGVKEEIKTG